MAVRSVNVNTLWKSKSQIVPAGKTKSNVMVLVTYRGPSAHAGVLPVTGVSTPSMVPTVSTAPTMADRLMTILLSAGGRVAAVREFFMVIPPGFVAGHDEYVVERLRICSGARGWRMFRLIARWR